MNGPFDFSKLGGGLPLDQIMQKALDMKENIEKERAALAAKTIEATAGGGMVTVVADGHGYIRSIRIEEAAIDPKEKELLEDLIQAAVNEARRKAIAAFEERMGSVTGSLGIPPGLSNLFG